MRNFELEKALLEILKEYPNGKSEYELFNILQRPPYCFFDKAVLSEPLALFQSHFLLFHSLYQIRSILLSQEAGDIQIITTQIKLLPYMLSKSGLSDVDRLQTYYLDKKNFAETTEKDVEKLIEGFWRKMRGEVFSYDTEAVRVAFSLFDLPVGSSFSQVKAAYHKAQHLHHPDKGGDKIKSQEFEANFQILKAHLHT